jgi:hypothetical protein
LSDVREEGIVKYPWASTTATSEAAKPARVAVFIFADYISNDERYETCSNDLSTTLYTQTSSAIPYLSLSIVQACTLAYMV